MGSISMAQTSRAQKHGLAAEASKKRAAAYDPEAAEQAIAWMHAVIGEDAAELASVGSASDKVQAALANGRYLCILMNKISPGAIAKIHDANAHVFKKSENVSFFLQAAEKYGCLREDLFQSVYLTEGSDMAQVINGIFALGRKLLPTGS